MIAGHMMQPTGDGRYTLTCNRCGTDCNQSADNECRCCAQRSSEMAFTQLGKALKRLHAAAELHRQTIRVQDGGYDPDTGSRITVTSRTCGHCHVSWPCETAKAIGIEVDSDG